MFNPKLPQNSTKKHGVTYRHAVVPKLPSFFQLIFFILQTSSLIFSIEVLRPHKTLAETKLRVLLEMCQVLTCSRNIHDFHGTRSFNAVLATVRHLSLPCVTSIQSTTSNSICWRSILILCPRLRLGLTNGLYPSGFLTKILHAFHLPSRPIRATRPDHLFVLNLINPITFVEKYKS